MSVSALSPIIIGCQWGKVTVRVSGSNPKATYRDVKLFPGGAEAWDWKATEIPTRHSPGIGMEDVLYLLERGATAIILSQGVHSKLETQPEVISYLDDMVHQNETQAHDKEEERVEEEGAVEGRVITYLIKPTPEAVKEYNRLAEEGVAVGALIHSTC